jgi:hypothetical protein
MEFILLGKSESWCFFKVFVDDLLRQNISSRENNFLCIGNKKWAKKNRMEA